MKIKLPEHKSRSLLLFIGIAKFNVAKQHKNSNNSTRSLFILIIKLFFFLEYSANLLFFLN